MNEETKPAKNSKTVIANALLATVVAVIPGGSELVASNPEISVAALSLINIILRFLTSKGVRIW